MNDEITKSNWISINLDDTVSEVKDSLKEAVCGKSAYIAEQIYLSQSWSGKTTYYKYKFYNNKGKRTFPHIGECELLSDITQGYYEFDHQKELIISKKYLVRYPLSQFGTMGTFNKCVLCDNEGEQKIVYLSDLADLLPLLRALSRAGCWEEFIFNQFINALHDEVKELKERVTKLGYSRKEYALEHEFRGIDKRTEQYFTQELEKLDLAIEVLLDDTDDEFKDAKNYKIASIKEDLDFISKVLEGEKPWRKYILN
ncbi:hypothetical protein WG947_07400 [Pontibacter sp. H259]|uniref:hypothetical protein n=1 Tax=Pontibacter sp. H259 TaxID=3133421 RepID=UPI0030BE6537